MQVAVQILEHGIPTERHARTTIITASSLPKIVWLCLLVFSIVTVEPDITFTTLNAVACVCVPFFFFNCYLVSAAAKPPTLILVSRRRPTGLAALPFFRKYTHFLVNNRCNLAYYTPVGTHTTLSLLAISLGTLHPEHHKRHSDNHRDVRLLGKPVLRKTAIQRTTPLAV